MTDLNILVLDARYHGAVADALVDGATAALEKGSVRFERVSLPGVLEIPPAIVAAARSSRPFDGYVALGCVLGFAAVPDMLYRETARGLMSLGLEGQMIGNGILLADDEKGALDLAQTQDAGGDAARACLSLVTLRERLGYLR